MHHAVPVDHKQQQRVLCGATGERHFRLEEMAVGGASSCPVELWYVEQNIIGRQVVGLADGSTRRGDKHLSLVLLVGQRLIFRQVEEQLALVIETHGLGARIAEADVKIFTGAQTYCESVGALSIGEQCGHMVGAHLLNKVLMIAKSLHTLQHAQQQRIVVRSEGSFGIQVFTARNMVAVEIVAKLGNSLCGDKRGEGKRLLDEEVIGRRVTAHYLA